MELRSNATPSQATADKHLIGVELSYIQSRDSVLNCPSVGSPLAGTKNDEVFVC